MDDHNSDISRAFAAIARNDSIALTSIFESGDVVALSLATEENGFTFLHFAASRGAHRCVEFLLANNSKANVETSSRSTPLHLAAFHGHSKVVRILLQNDTDVLRRDCDGQTPLCIARMLKHQSTVNILVNYCTEQCYLTVPRAPNYLSCSRYTVIGSITPNLRIIIGALPKMNSFKICLPEQLSPLFQSTKEFVDETDQLPLLWIKVNIRQISDREDIENDPNILNNNTNKINEEQLFPPRVLLFRIVDLPISIRDLTPGTRYAVKVATVNGIGCSLYGRDVVIETKSKIGSFFQKYINKMSYDSILHQNHSTDMNSSFHMNSLNGFKDNRRASNHPVLIARISNMIDLKLSSTYEYTLNNNIHTNSNSGVTMDQEEIPEKAKEEEIKKEKDNNSKNTEGKHALVDTDVFDSSDQKEFSKYISSIPLSEFSSFLLPLLTSYLFRGNNVLYCSTNDKVQMKKWQSIRNKKMNNSLNITCLLVLEVAEQLAIICYHLRRELMNKEVKLCQFIHLQPQEQTSKTMADMLEKKNLLLDNDNEKDINVELIQNVVPTFPTSFQTSSSSILSGKLGQQLSKASIHLAVEIVIGFCRISCMFASTHCLSNHLNKYSRNYDGNDLYDDNDLDDELEYIDHHNVLYQKLSEFEIVKLKKINQKLKIKTNKTKLRYQRKSADLKSNQILNHFQFDQGMIYLLYLKVGSILEEEESYKLKEKQFNAKHHYDHQRHTKESFILHQYRKNKLIDSIKKQVWAIEAIKANGKKAEAEEEEEYNKKLREPTRAKELMENCEREEEREGGGRKDAVLEERGINDIEKKDIVKDGEEQEDTFGDILAQIPMPIICQESPTTTHGLDPTDMHESQMEQTQQFDFSMALEELANETTRASIELGSPLGKEGGHLAQRLNEEGDPHDDLGPLMIDPQLLSDMSCDDLLSRTRDEDVRGAEAELGNAMAELAFEATEACKVL